LILVKNGQINEMWDFQLNTKVTQQPYEDQPSLNQVEVLNESCKNEGESLLNISLEEILAANAVNRITVINDEMVKILKS